MAVSAPDTQLLDTEAMQKLVTTYQTDVGNYYAKLKQVQGKVADLVTDALKGDKGQGAFHGMQGDWHTQITNIVSIIDDVSKKVGRQSALFQQVDTSAATNNASQTVTGFGG